MIETLNKKLQRERGSQAQIHKTLAGSRETLKQHTRELRRHEQANAILREVGQKTQQELQYHISDITSLALNAVFDDPYELKVEFIQRRNKIECDLLFVRDGQEADPLTASGGGAVDVASFALRIASFAMERPRLRNVMVLDEPLRFLSANYQEKASKMLSEISQRMNIQFIMVTHEPVLTAYADKSFDIRIKRGVSHVKNE